MSFDVKSKLIDDCTMKRRKKEIFMEQVLMQDAQRWVAPQAAWLVAREGTLWVTRSGDLDDHVLARGERLAVTRGDDLVLQSWRRDLPAVWDWQAKPAARDGLLSWVWDRSARGLRGVAAVFDTLAGAAASRGSGAEGCRNSA
jgi:hypothetical protein